jgi:septal ring factor EnvC (AmiA/AmiB activator)
MSAVAINVNLPLFIPIVIAVITAVIGPIWLSRHKETVDERNRRIESSGELSVRIIDEGRDMRKELRDRIDSLEARLAQASKDFQAALDEIRKLRSTNDRLTNQIQDLRREVDQHRQSMISRVDALEHHESESISEKDKPKNDDRITELPESGDSDGTI